MCRALRGKSVIALGEAGQFPLNSTQSCHYLPPVHWVLGTEGRMTQECGSWGAWRWGAAEAEVQEKDRSQPDPALCRAPPSALGDF